MEIENDLISKAAKELHNLLEPLRLLPTPGERSDESGPDLVMRVEHGGRAWSLVCQVIPVGEPRFVRAAALYSREIARRAPDALQRYPLVMAPFISAASGAICRALGVGYADLAGNCFLTFDAVYIERAVPKNPFREKRARRSLFAAKSARVLRTMLSDRPRAWKVAELAERADVSYGLVSNVRQHLVDREWAEGGWGGIRLTKPHALLEAWRNAYEPPAATRLRFYTLLHGDALWRALRDGLASRPAVAGDASARVLLNSFSAARWMAPYARIAGEFFYADAAGAAALQSWLKLEPATKGENITIDVVQDVGVFFEAEQPAEGLWSTGKIQTYLDLAVSGERGAESAQHLLDGVITPFWDTVP